MKKYLSALLFALMLFTVFASLVSCAEPVADVDVTALGADVYEKYVTGTGGYIFSSDAGEDTNSYLFDDDIVRSYYGDAAEYPDFSGVDSYYAYIDSSTPTQPCEFGIFKLTENADKQLFQSFLKARVTQMLANAKNYTTVEKTALQTAEFGIKGNYVWYSVIKDHNTDVNDLIESRLNGRA